MKSALAKLVCYAAMLVFALPLALVAALIFATELIGRAWRWVELHACFAGDEKAQAREEWKRK